MMARPFAECPVCLSELQKDVLQTPDSALMSGCTSLTCLSPVRTQMRIPALARCSMHSGTPSCSLSSIAVQPTKMRFFSMSSLTSASFSSRPVRHVLASKYLSCHLQQVRCPINLESACQGRVSISSKRASIQQQKDKQTVLKHVNKAFNESKMRERLSHGAGRTHHRLAHQAVHRRDKEYEAQLLQTLPYAGVWSL